MKTPEEYLVRKPNHVDTASLSKWADASDGRRTIINNDETVIELFRLWQADACDHPRVGIVKTAYEGGGKAYNWYCAKCGTKLSANIPKVLAMSVQEEGVTGQIMLERSNAYEQKRRDALILIETEAADRCQKANREAYGNHLDSDYWRILSQRVMRRAQNVCEGCLSQTADHVHHLTYEHIGAEFAFELVALCAECHERVHSLDKD